LLTKSRATAQPETVLPPPHKASELPTAQRLLDAVKSSQPPRVVDDRDYAIV